MKCAAPVTHAAEFWQERVRMMRWWADELDRLREHGRVIKMSARGKVRSKWNCSLKSHVH